MIELTADEARVLGVLIEKAQTTPDQYPLSLNGITNGANYSSGRRLADTGAANFLNYELYQPAAVGGAAACAYTQAYGTAGAGLFAVAGSNFTSASTSVTVKICGRVPGGQDVPATGNYTDAVTVNVNF